MNPEDSDHEIQKLNLPYKYKLDWKKQKCAVLSKVKYVTDRSEYDILDKVDYESFLDYLSANSTEKPCPQQIKTLVWDSCEKQARGGILIRNIMQFVAGYLLNDNPTEIKVQLADVFVKQEFRQKEFKQQQQERKFYCKEIAIKVLPCISGVLVGYNWDNLRNINPVKIVKQLTKDMIESGAQRNPLLYPSVEPVLAVRETTGNVAAGNYSSFADNDGELFGKVAKSNVASRMAEQSHCQISSAVQKVFSENPQIILTPQVNNFAVIQHSDSTNVFSGFSFAYIQSVFKKVFRFLERGCFAFGDFLRGLLFEKNQLDQTFKFSLSLTMFNMFQAVSLIWAVSLMCRNETKEQKKFQIDRLFYS